MSKLFIIVFMAVMPAVCFAQSTLHFTYDDAGNRTERTIVVSSQAPMLDATSVNNLYEDTQIRISNNEANVLKVEIMGLQGTAHLSVYNSSGRQYVTTEITSTVSVVNISTVPKGVYVLSIDINGEKNTWKLIKK